MKRHKQAPHENHERWLVSYADFITLLFAFFVVMFATAQKDKTKQRMVSESVRNAIEHGQLTAAITGILSHKVNHLLDFCCLKQVDFVQDENNLLAPLLNSREKCPLALSKGPIC